MSDGTATRRDDDADVSADAVSADAASADTARADTAGADADELVNALAQVAFAIMAVLGKAATDNDLSLTQLRAIEILRDRRLRMTELAQLLGLEKSSLSGLVVRAENRGLLQRVPDDADGRSVRVTIAPAGEALALTTRAAVREAMEPLTSGLSDRQQQQLAALLERMLAHAHFGLR